MTVSRRAVLLATLWGAVAPALPVGAAETPTVSVGVLRFGTVSWELDVVRRHGFDAQSGVSVQPVAFAGSQATQVALQAGRVDMTVQDWLWVSRQRASGADWTMVPFSNAVGAVVVPRNSPLQRVSELPGRHLGIAGSPLDKSWLILRAYAEKEYKLDLDHALRKNFGAPPLIQAELEQGRLDAELTFWPFAARAEAAGMRSILDVAQAIRGLGVAADVPITGYVFSEKWANAHPQAIRGFVQATAKARELLEHSDAEWEKLRPLTRASSDAELHRLRDYYRSGIPRHWGPPEWAAAAKLYDILARIGGPKLVGGGKTLAPGTFWQPRHGSG